MKKLMLLAVGLCASTAMFGQQFYPGVDNIGPGGQFTIPHQSCIQSGNSPQIKFKPTCPQNGGAISNTQSTAIFSDQGALGGAEIFAQNPTTKTVDFKVKSYSVINAQADRYPVGRIIADYTCTYDSTFTVTSAPCNGVPTTTSVTVSKKIIGQSYVDFFQSFNWDLGIVGPKCVKDGDKVTYSIFDYVSGPVSTKDKYTWTKPAGWNVLYYSFDSSSITLKANTVNPNTDQLTVMVGQCNAPQIKSLSIQSPGTVAAPVVQKEYCLNATETTWNVGFATSTTPNATYSWDILADGNAYTYNYGSTTTQGNIGVNIGNAATGYVILKSTISNGGQGCPDAERTDTIRFSRGFNSASISGPSCVAIGQSYTYSITGANANTLVNWTLPAGMTITSGNPQATTITVNVTAALSYAGISANVALGSCGGYINGLYNINTIPTIGTITGPVCVAKNASNIQYTINASDFDNLTWTSPTGMTGGGYTTYYGNTSNAFVGGTISIIASKGTCASAPATLALELNPAGSELANLTADKSCFNNGANDQVVLTTDAGYNTYNWTIPAGWSIIGAANQNVVTLATNGTGGTVSVTGGNTCGNSNAKTLVLSADGAGEVTVSTGIVGNVQLLTATNIPSATYQWMKDGVDINGATNFFITLPVAGSTISSYCVKVTLNSCLTQTCVSSTYQPQARKALTDLPGLTSVTALPNPASANVSLVHAKELDGISYIVVDSNGKTIFKNKFSNNTETINVSTWAEGLYIVQYEVAGSNNYIKFQVVK